MAVFPQTRLVRGALGATLSHQFVDADGEPADPSTVGTVTVAVTRSDGTAVTVGAVAGAGTNARTVTVDPGELSVTDWLYAAWSIEIAGTPTVVARDVAEVVGGLLRPFSEVTALDPGIGGAEDVRRGLRAVEDTLLAELHRSPVERFYREQIRGTGRETLRLHWPDVSEVVWCNYSLGGSTVEVDPADLQLGPGTRLARKGYRCWPSGSEVVEVGYRFGMLAVPQDLADNLILALRHHLGLLKTNSAIYRAETVRTVDGVVMSVARAGIGVSITGNDDVDSSIRRHAYRPALVA